MSGAHGNKQFRVRLEPIGKTVLADVGAPLRDLLFEDGGEFPCGGQGRCRGCRVRVLAGDLAISPAQSERLSEAELASGWRLACQCKVQGDLSIELRQWDAAILAGDLRVAFTPQDGLGVAVDVGTTTLVAQLLDLSNGRVLAVRTGLNAQARCGADIMSRIHYAQTPEGQRELGDGVRGQVGKMIGQLLTIAARSAPDVRSVVLVGNTAMHHLFCGIDIAPLAAYPFEPLQDGLCQLDTATLDWPVADAASVRFLPCLGGFVGSDILAGILATGLADSERLACFLDLGTNGEIVLGNRDRLLCASAAAGPAFEGARIGMGMRAATGAIWQVRVDGEELRCEVLGNAAPTGICGSGLVDAVAAGLCLSRIRPDGRLVGGDYLPLAGPVRLGQPDIRQLQLAKGAIAAGIRLLLAQWGRESDQIERVYLAGAFGNYINRESAKRIGLLPFPLDRIEPAGNTALQGAKIALCSGEGNLDYQEIRARVWHVGLSADPRFQDVFVEEMRFGGA